MTPPCQRLVRRHRLLPPGRPVNVRKTSSSVGRRTPTSSTAIPASSSRRSASTSTAAPPLIGTVSRAGVRLGRRASPTATGASTPTASASLGGVAHGDLQPFAADLGLELVGGALGDDPAVVDHHDGVGQQVGLLQVLRGEQQRGATRDQPVDHVPHVDPAARVQARWSARPGTAPAGSRPGRPPGPGGGACRPSRSARAGPPRPRAGSRSAARGPAPAPADGPGGTADRSSAGSRTP